MIQPSVQQVVDTSVIPTFMTFWGKAQSDSLPPAPRSHPLAFHSLDVAATGRRILELDSSLRRRISSLLGMGEEDCVALLVQLLAMHDLGKFARAFQAKAPECFPRSVFGVDPQKVSTSYDHATGGYELASEHAVPVLGRDAGQRSGIIWLLRAVVGHHGVPPAERDGDASIARLRREFGDSGIAAALTFAVEVRRLLPTASVDPDPKLARSASFAVAGFAVLADWVGSNQKWFPYADVASYADLDAYWAAACRRAEIAVEAAGILPTVVSAPVGITGLTGESYQSTPMQAWANTVTLPDGPSLFLIEDETGSGKTEAALLLAHRLMAAGRGDGLHIGLPTMATANAMFDRLSKIYRRLFVPAPSPSLVLAHGRSDMHPGFRASILATDATHERYGNDDGVTDETASSACAAWIADDRRRAFLADVGVGTIDQALLAILPVRHQSLRLFGLARRILILDEIHAYDAYMDREIEQLLHFHAMLGGSAILLSATLPVETRTRLVARSRSGLGAAVVDVESTSRSYPLATVASAAAVEATPVDPWPGRGRRVQVKRVAESLDAIEALAIAAANGAAAVYIRNSVDDAVDSFTALRERGVNATLFHARFALSDRLKRETEIMGWFGRNSKPTDRAGRVLVATQVVEQSLDLDFDLMATDLAPIDLVIQRAGRLWRHRRPERSGEPALLVVSPDPAADVDADWFSRAFPRGAHVYQDHARLWLTADELFRRGAIVSPEELRDLVEAVYGEAAEARLPRSLHDPLLRAEGRAGASRGIATTNILKPSDGYVASHGKWGSDERTPTRLADQEQRVVRLARFRNGRITPWAEDDDERRAWRLSEVMIAAWRAAGEIIAPSHAAAVAAARGPWSSWDQKTPIAVLEEASESDCFRTALRNGKGQRVEFNYSVRTGLAIVRGHLSASDGRGPER